MYKIKHKATGKYLSTSGHRYFWWLHNEPSTRFLSKYGKVWSAKRGPQRTLAVLERFFPGEFELAKFVEE